MEYRQEVIKNWILIEQTQDEVAYMRPLFSFVLGQFVEIFGTGLMEAELCVVFNEANAPYPMLIINKNPIQLRVNATSLNHWAQYIYQLSHELTHYVIRQYKENKDSIIKWFEETLCEAMSLYILRQSSVKWSDCTLSKVNPDYHSALKSYLNDIYNRTDKSVIRACHTLSELQEIEQSSESQRLDRSMERNYLYDTFCEFPESIAAFVFYPLYARSDLQLDLDRWEKETKNSLISKLREVHPILIA